MLSSPAKRLDALGLEHINPVHVQQMDSVDHIGEMQEVGDVLAEQKVKAEHFAGFPGGELACLFREWQAHEVAHAFGPATSKFPSKTSNS